MNGSRGKSCGFIWWKYNIFTQVVGGRALIQSELDGKDDAYEYIWGIYVDFDDSVVNCNYSKYEKQEVAVLLSAKV